MSQRYVQTPAIGLYAPISPSDVSAVVTPYPRDIQTGRKLVFADFGTDPTFTVDPKVQDYEEINSFTGLIDNGDDTGTLTGLTRNLIGEYPYVTPGTGKQHGSGAPVVFSNNPQLYGRLASKENDNTYTGLNIFEGIAPQTDTDPISADDLTRKSYVDALVLGTLTTINVIVPGTAGATIAAGNLVYFDDASNKWLLTDADTASTVENVLLGIAQGAGTNNNPILNGVLLQGVDTHQSGLTDGQTQYASNTPGAISTSPGTTVVVVGISKGTTQLYFKPNFNQQITQNQLNAMAGTSGIPSATNKFETENDTSNAATITAITLSFTASSKTIADSGSGFVTANFRPGDSIIVSGTSSNNGTYTIISVAAGAIVVAETLVNEIAGGSFTLTTVTINKVVRYSGSSQVKVPLVPVSTTDAGSKSYIDATAGAGLALATALRNEVPNTDLDNTWFTWTIPALITTISGPEYDPSGFVKNGNLSSPSNDAGGGGATLIPSGSANWFATLPGNGSNNNYTAASNKDLKWKYRFKYAGALGGSNYGGIGVVDAATTFDDINTAVTTGIRFVLNNATLYAVTGDGTNNQNTNVSASLTYTDWNTFQIVFNPGVDVKFYINGTLVATHSAPNIPTGSLSGFGFGSTTGNLGRGSPIVFSLEI